MIILDTNVVSEPMRPAPDPNAVEWLDDQVVETLYLTTITLAEIRCGIEQLRPSKRRTTLRGRFEDDVLPVFEDRILGFDEPAASAFARLQSKAIGRGQRLSPFDALIAGIADSCGFGVATRDSAPFVSAGIKVIDPFAERG